MNTKEFKNHLISEEKSEATVERYMRDVTAYITWLDGREMSKELMIQYKAELVDKYDFIETRRGSGLMQGLVFNKPVGEYINKALENGLILINAGANIIRFVPSLVISKENVDEMIAILEKVL